jgi:hypothetical protein
MSKEREKNVKLSDEERKKDLDVVKFEYERKKKDLESRNLGLKNYDCVSIIVEDTKSKKHNFLMPFYNKVGSLFEEFPCGKYRIVDEFERYVHTDISFERLYKSTGRKSFGMSFFPEDINVKLIDKKVAKKEKKVSGTENVDLDSK